jgi:hypothetical protein
LLYNFTSKIQNLDKAIFHTHKINRKKEYEFSKQKNNRNGIVSVFSVLKIHTLSEEPHLSKQNFLDLISQEIYRSREK